MQELFRFPGGRCGPRGFWVGGLTILFLSAAAYVVLHWIWVWPYAVSQDTDFARYLAGARLLRQGQSPYALYDLDYPPLVPLLFVPWTLLDPRTAHILWFVTNHLLFVAAAYLFWHRLGGGRELGFSVVAVWSLLGAAPQSLALGQLNFLLLFLVVLWWPPPSPYRTRHWPLALAGALKLYPMVCMLVELCRRGLRAVLRLFALFFLGVGLPLASFALWGLEPLRPASSWYWLGTPSMFNLGLPAQGLRLLTQPPKNQPFPQAWVTGNLPSAMEAGEPSPWPGMLLAILGLLVFLGWFARLLRQRPQAAVDPLLPAVVLAGTFLWLPIVWNHYHLLQYPGISLGAARLFQERRRSLGLLVLVCGLLLTWTSLLGLEGYRQAYGWVYTNPGLFWMVTGGPWLVNLALLGLLTQGLGRGLSGT